MPALRKEPQLSSLYSRLFSTVSCGIDFILHSVFLKSSFQRHCTPSTVYILQQDSQSPHGSCSSSGLASVIAQSFSGTTMVSLNPSAHVGLPASSKEYSVAFDLMPTRQLAMHAYIFPARESHKGRRNLLPFLIGTESLPTEQQRIIGDDKQLS